MKATATTASTSNPPDADVRNLNDLPALIECADDIVALIARNRTARAGLGRTGRAVLRDHERMLSAELAGIKELASHAKAASVVEAQFLLILATADLGELRTGGPEPGRVAILDRIERLLHGARWGLDTAGDGEHEGTPLYRIAEQVAPFIDGPHSRVALAMTQIAAAEAVDNV